MCRGEERGNIFHFFIIANETKNLNVKETDVCIFFSAKCDAPYKFQVYTNVCEHKYFQSTLQSFMRQAKMVYHGSIYSFKKRQVGFQLRNQ